MKILILTSTAERHQYFAIRLIRALDGEVSVIQEPKGTRYRKKGGLDRLRRYFRQPSLARNAVLNRIFAGSLSRVEKEKQEAESRFFGNQQDADVVLLRERTLRVLEKGQSVNEPDTVELIRGLGPDIIAVMGTSLIKSAIIGIPRLGVLNIHTGLSPYYRGGRTNFWPFIYGELGRCGVTVHLLDSGIDSGDIIYHAIPEIGEADTYSSINCKMIVEGTGLMIRAIRDLVAGNIRSFRQWEGGRLFYNRDYNGLAAYRYLRTRARAVKVFLEKPEYPEKIFVPGGDTA